LDLSSTSVVFIITQMLLPISQRPDCRTYKHTAVNSPASKPALLGHYSFWSTPYKIRNLKDQQIHVIEGYCLTEHLHTELVKVCNALNKEKRDLPETAALIVVKRFMEWDEYRTCAAEINMSKLCTARDDIAKAILEVTTLQR
jgi:hypothetical protein